VQALSVDASQNEIDAVLLFDKGYLDQLHEIARQYFNALRYDGTPGQQKRIRYTLARVNHFLNLKGPVENLSLGDFLVTSKATKRKRHPGFDIDHIMAKAQPGFGEAHQHIGNLTLLHTIDNMAEGANPPPDKDVSYGHSKCYATRALTRKFPQPNQVEAVIAPYRVAVIDGTESWGADQMDARANMYWTLLTEAISVDLGYQLKG